jgi:hypothetical protein
LSTGTRCNWKELYYDFKRNRITEDSEKLCQVGIGQVKRVHRRKPELLDVLGEDTPPGGRRGSVQIGTRRKRLFEFWKRGRIH